MGWKGLTCLLLGLTNAQECCHKKVVTAPAEHAGTFTFVRKFDGEKDSNCADSCIYHKDGVAGKEYCFKAVDKDAATINGQCDATPEATSVPTGPTSAPPTTAAEDPATTIKKTNGEIVAEHEKIITAESASTIVDSISSALASGTKNRSLSDSATITQCSEFGSKFEDLISHLKQLDGDKADDKIPWIKELVRILNESLSSLDAICTTEKKKDIDEKTTNDVMVAKEITRRYKEKKERKIKDLVVKVEIQYVSSKVNSGIWLV